MKRVTLVGLVGLSCLVAACGSNVGQQGESVGEVSSALVDKSVSIGDTPVSPVNEQEELGSVAAGAGMYLVAWGRVDADSSVSLVSRVSGTGELLDPHGIVVPGSEKLGSSHAPDTQALFDGKNFRVVSDGRLTRFTPQGDWLDGPGVDLGVNLNYLVCMDDGNCYGLSTDYDDANEWVTRFVRIDENNQLVKTPLTQSVLEEVDEPGLFNASARLVRVGQRVAWVYSAFQEQQGTKLKIWVNFFDPASGNVTPALEVASGSTQTLDELYAVAGRDGEALFVWAQRGLTDGGNYDWMTMVRRIGSDGKALEPARKIALSGEDSQRIGSLFYTGSDYALALRGATSLRRLSDTGELTSGTLALGRDDGPELMNLASTGDSMLLATSHASEPEYPDDPRLFVKPFSQSGEDLGAAQPIEAGINHMSEPAVAWGGDNYFTVWVDDRKGVGRADLFGARVSPDGTQLDTPAHLLAGFADAWQSKPAIASSGNGYLVVNQTGYLYESTVWVTFVDAQGVAAPGARLTWAAEPDSAPAVAWNGSNYLAAWVSTDRGVDDLYVTRFAEKGGQLEDSVWIATIAVDVHGSWGPTVAATQDGFFLSWRQQAGGTERDVYGVWLEESEGALVAKAAPKSLTGGPFVDSSVAYQDTGAACSPDVCLLAWHDADGATKFRRFDSEGEALGPTSTLPNAVLRPLVAWDGKAFLISNADTKVVAGYLTEAGEPTTATFPLATPNEVSGVALATDGAGHALIVTASDEDHERFTGILLSNDVVTEPSAGGGGQPGYPTAGTGGGAPLAGAATSGGEGDGEAGQAGDTSAGSGGSSAGTASEPRKTDKGCGCIVASGETSSSPWLLLGLLGVFARRRRR